MRKLPHLLIALILFGSPAMAGTTPGTFVYQVDMQKALAQTPEGKAVKVKLETEQRRKQKEFDAWARAIEAKRDAAEKSGDEAQKKEVERDQQRLMQALVEAQRGVVEEEQRQVKKIVASLEAIIDRAEAAQAQVHILQASRVRLINLPAVCDRTEWLVRARVSGDESDLGTDRACRFERFARIDMQRIMDDSRAGRAALARLKKEHREMQAEVDRRSQELKRIKSRGDEEAFMRELSKLDALYKAFQKQLDERQTQERDRLVTEMSAAMAKATAEPILFVAQAADPPPPLRDGCEATAWALKTFDGDWGPDGPQPVCAAEEKGPEAPAQAGH